MWARSLNTDELILDVHEVPASDTGIWTLQFTTSGRHLLFSSGSSIFLWGIDSRDLPPRRIGNARDQWKAQISDIWEHPSGPRIATFRGEQVVRVWELETLTQISSWIPPKARIAFRLPTIYSLAKVLNGRQLAVAVSGADAAVYLVDSETGRMVGEPLRDKRRAQYLVWTQSIGGTHHRNHDERDGFLATGSPSGSLSVWNLTNRQRCIDNLDLDGSYQGHYDLRCLAFSPDGSILAAFFGNGIVFLYDSSNGKSLVGPLKGQQSGKALAFSLSGEQLICAGKDASIRIWDVQKVLDHASTFLKSSAPGSDANHRGSADRSVDSDSRSWFNDTSSPDNLGWLKGPNGELLLWIPPTHRKSLLRPSNIVTDAPGFTKLDFSRFVAGESWAECYQPNLR